MNQFMEVNVKNIFLLGLILCFVNIGFAQENEPSEVIPIVSISPVYPLKALINRTEGNVKILMHINSLGSVDSVEVLDSSHPGLFDNTSIAAGLKFKFKPKFVDGQAVNSKASITINYELPKGQISIFDEPLFQTMRNQIAEIPYDISPVVIADTVKIKSKIKPKKVTDVNFFYSDDLLILNNKPVLWDGQEKAMEEIPEFEKHLEQHNDLVREQYETRPGIFKQFHRIFSAHSHPPVLLTAVDSIDEYNHDGFKEHKYKLLIDKSGKITSWESLLGEKYNQNPYLRKSIGQLMNSLLFYPAIKDGEKVEDEISIEFKTKSFNQLEVLAYAYKRNEHHNFNHPWVKIATMISKKGKIEQLKVLASSNSAFEPLAKEKLSMFNNYKKQKNTWFRNHIVEFELQGE